MTQCRLLEDVKKLCAEMFRKVARNAKENTSLNQRLINMATIAIASDVAWVLKQYEDWDETLEEAADSRKRELNTYQRMLKKPSSTTSRSLNSW